MLARRDLANAASHSARASASSEVAGSKPITPSGVKLDPISMPKQSAGAVARTMAAKDPARAMQAVENIDGVGRLPPAVVFEHLRQLSQDASAGSCVAGHLRHEHEPLALTEPIESAGDLLQRPDARKPRFSLGSNQPFGLRV